MKWLKWVGIAFLAVVVLGIISDFNNFEGVQDRIDDTPIASEAATPDAIKGPENDPGISAAEFGKLKIGMSYEDAITLIGSDGELMSENEIAGTRTTMYQWKGDGGFGSNANAMFQNNKLIQKAQFGLE